jgi:hypothetical protein
MSWRVLTHHIPYGFETMHSEFCLKKCIFLHISCGFGRLVSNFINTPDFSYSVTLCYAMSEHNFFFRAFSFQVINPSTLKDGRRPAHNILRGCNFCVYRKIRKDPIPMWTFRHKIFGRKEE